MVKIAVDEKEAELKSRLALVAILSCNLTLMENWRRLHAKIWGKSLDYESTVILAAIVVIGSERLLHGVEPAFQTLGTAIPADRLRPCNLSSISAATSLNRETVRRRIVQLEDAGVVSRGPKGSVRMIIHDDQRDAIKKAVKTQLNLIRRTAMRLTDFGIFNAS